MRGTLIVAECARCGLIRNAAAPACPRCGAAWSAQVIASTHPNDDLAEQTLPRPRLPVQPDPTHAPSEPSGNSAAVNPSQAAALRYILRAPAGTRLAASLIDAVVLGSVVFGSLVAVSLVDRIAVAAQPYPEVMSVMGWLLVAMIPVSYAVILNGRGQTIGKRALRIVVIDRTNAAPIGIRRSALRLLVMLGMGLPLGLGYLSVPMSPTVQGWHDEAVDDLVVMLSAPQLTNRP